ncbi:branched-chain amino acid ABC transporter permease [Vulcanimicrobium alpinum]|uniref:Branched-chain amino acid ABC transporter permease n=1 Tax=Vulcanimicrobium alpinum TaxID=3016050 RepID=A0AAN1XYP3_UNVUL|nr:branched-chain amino acid ABC transporter permease [Vulcanimicrobium alpinum]BDE07820.1 branched-chain amino acid ABC transporter permease [Vulcanimicrobium alpinum]
MEALTTFAQLLAGGVLTGLVFALVAVGLTLVYGVMDVVNFAHGEFLMLAMYATLGLALIGLSPFAGLPLVAIALFLFGIVVYRVFIRRLLAGPPEATVFGTFGLLVLLQGLAQALFSSDFLSVPHPPLQGTLRFGGLAISQATLAEGAGALVLTAALFAFVEYTETGRAMRAVAEDRVAATLMGIDVQRVNGLAFGIGAACVGAAGALLMLSYPVFPTAGAPFALTAFVVVALGGFGSIQGALVGALLVGLLEVFGGFYLSPELKMVPVYLAYLAIVLVRPQGLLGRR